MFFSLMRLSFNLMKWEQNLYFHQSTEYFPKGFEDHQNIFGKKWNRCLCFWSELAFALKVYHGCHFFPSLLNIVETWTLNLTETSKAFSVLDVTEDWFVSSWMSCWSTLGVLLVGELLQGRFTTVLLVDKGSIYSLES